MLMIKLERFNNLNIIYGNEFTNQILKEAALQLIYMMDENSAVYRLDGPKFGFILRGCDREKLLIFEQTLRKRLAKGIHQSVREGCEGFYVEYQPIVVSKTGRIAGTEALVRWRREPYGTVPPGMFIEWMETDPGMYELGNYVLQTALQETVGLLEILPEFVLNVNVSARQMEREEFRA